MEQTPLLVQHLKVLARRPSDEQGDGAIYQERLVLLLAMLYRLAT
ncbi:MAG: hypothetical protein ACFC1C_02710 [Candidatus Malihini olakiniferum]